MATRDGDWVAHAQVDGEGRFVVLLPADDAAPVRLAIAAPGNDERHAAALDDVAPGMPDVRLVVPK